MRTITRNTLKLAVALLVIAGLLGAGFKSSVAYAAPTCASTGNASFDLWATPGTATLFGTTSVTIWGYSTTAGGAATLPGPVIDVNQGTDVTVNLTNNLAEDSAMLFQGQDMIPDTVGAPANGGTKTYTFRACDPGTFLYEAGLTPNGQHQVAMGLYGALIVRPVDGTNAPIPNQAYGDASTAYDSESVMVLSELDPALNSSGSPATFDMRNYSPQYFLINGKAYPDAVPFAVDPGPGSKMLLRYVNAGLQAHAMSTLGLSQTIIAQDGEAYLYSHKVVAESIATGQTLDTILAIPASANQGDKFTVYDANMLLHNSSAAGFGGMMAFLTVGTGTPPVVDLGPTVSGLSLSPNPTNGLLDVTVSATVTDGGTNATTIAAAEFYIDGTANTPNAMVASDGTFDGNPENVTGTISAATLGSLASGNHTIFVRGQDANLNWGPFVSVILNLDKTGPTTKGLTLTPNPSSGAEPVDLTATGDDTATGGTDVTAAEYWVDGGTHVAMTVSGAVSAVTNFTATISPPLSIGSHTVSVQSQDWFGNLGPVATITLQVADPEPPTTSNVSASPNPTNGLVGYNTSVPAVRVFADFSDVATGGSNIVAAEGFIDTVGSTGTGFVFVATDGGFNSPSESGYGDIPLASVRALSDGNHTIYVHAKDSSGNWGDPTLATTILTVDKTGPTFGPITVSPAGVSRGGGTQLVTVSGNITTLSDLNFSSGAYSITDSKSNNVVNGTYVINPDGSFSFNVDISRSNSGQNNPANRRYYTFTITAADNLGNVGTATAQFWVQ